MSEAVTIRSVNGGNPFLITRDDLPPSVLQNATRAKVAVYKDFAGDLTGVDADLREEILQDARDMAKVAQMEVLIYEAIKARYPSDVEAMTPQAFVQSLTMDEYKSLVFALGGREAAHPLGDTEASTPTTN